jgi:two-component system nitrogen regulation sensor histidine kinase GlnL
MSGGNNAPASGALLFERLESNVRDARDRILDNLSTAVLAFDAQLRLTSVNPAGEMLIGASAKKIVGQRLAEIVPGGRRLEDTLRQTLVARRSFTARGVPLRLPAGGRVTVDCTATPLIDDNAGNDALIVELVQVDRWMKLAREENEIDRQAANRAVMRGLAHEIKNPLGGLRGAAQLLERELPDKDLREYTRIIIHEADRLRNLVDRMTGPTRALQREPLNIHSVLEHVRKLIEVENPAGLTIRRHYDPSLPLCAGDRESLIQALLNIVRNAVQALGGRGTIELRTRVERGLTLGSERHRLALRVDVEDHGPGIPEELRERIFYPMVTGRPEGTGLGLAIAQDLVQRHGGLIAFESEPGRTVFSLYLPLENS